MRNEIVPWYPATVGAQNQICKHWGGKVESKQLLRAVGGRVSVGGVLKNKGLLMTHFSERRWNTTSTAWIFKRWRSSQHLVAAAFVGEQEDLAVIQVLTESQRRWMRVRLMCFQGFFQVRSLWEVLHVSEPVWGFAGTPHQAGAQVGAKALKPLRYFNNDWWWKKNQNQ